MLRDQHLENKISWGAVGYQNEQDTRNLDCINWIVLQFEMEPRYYNILSTAAIDALHEQKSDSLQRFWRILRGVNIAGDLEPGSILFSWVNMIEGQFAKCEAEISKILSPSQVISELWDSYKSCGQLICEKFIGKCADDLSSWYPRRDYGNKISSHRGLGALFSMFWTRYWNDEKKVWYLRIDVKNTRLCFADNVAPKALSKFWRPARLTNFPVIKLRPDPANLVVRSNEYLIKSAIIRWLFDPSERYVGHDLECIAIDPADYEKELIISSTIEIEIRFKGVDKYKDKVLAKQSIELWSVTKN